MPPASVAVRTVSIGRPAPTWYDGDRDLRLDRREESDARPCALCGRHVEVRHRPHGARPEGEDEDTALARSRDHGRGVRSVVGQPEHDDVRPDGRRIQHHVAAADQAVRDQAGVRMIVGEATDVVVQREQAGRAKIPTWRIAPPAIRR